MLLSFCPHLVDKQHRLALRAFFSQFQSLTLSIVDYLRPALAISSVHIVRAPTVFQTISSTRSSLYRIHWYYFIAAAIVPS